VRDRRLRRDEQRYVIEGPRLIAEALDARVGLESVLLEARSVPALAARLVAAGVPWDLVLDGALDGVGDARTSQGALAVAVAPPLDGPLAAGVDLALVLVGLADPGNVGTVVRTADAAGAVVVLSGGGADVLAPKVVRAAAGACFRVPLLEIPDVGDALALVGGHGLARVGAVARGGTELDEVELSGPVAIVVGSEAHGLPPGTERQLDQLVTIPMPGRAESLNVAMAATVLTFEALRQRRAAARAHNRLDAGRPAGQGGWR
jgi:TrmH family RNA methyltransferase